MPAMPLSGTRNSERVLARVLEVARHQLGMDIAWISDFAGGMQRLRAVEGDAQRFGVGPGFEAPYEGAYCARVLAGELPAVIPDSAADSRTRDLAITQELGIGAYVGAPLRAADGSVYGMLCCVSRSAEPELDAKDARFLGLLAQVAAEEMDLERARSEERDRRAERIDRAVRGECLTIALQPIVDLRTMTAVGAEALARFTLEPEDPAPWFEDAARLGRSAELELTAIAKALECLPALPDDMYLSVNASPETLMVPGFDALLADVPGGRLQVEVTEQEQIADYDAVARALARMRARGMRVAVDDAGAGYAGLRQILRLDPDVIKLDIALTRDIDTDPARQALARSLADFAGHVGAVIVAEGVETQGELDTLLWLGVGAAQGFFLARPQPLPLPPVVARPTPRRYAAGNDGAIIGQLAQASSETSTLEEIVRPLLEAVVARTGLESSYLAIKHDERDALEVPYVFNASTLALPEPFTLEWTDSLCNRSREQGLLWTADVATDLPGSATVAEFGLRTFLSVAVTVGTPARIIGTLCAVSRTSRYLGARDIAEVELLARLAGERLARGDAPTASG